MYAVCMIGIDEVGRGAWAGPLLVVAARQHKPLPVRLTDSKLLSKKSREALVAFIREACDLGLGWVWPKEIDEMGLTKATQLAVQKALDELGAASDEEIIMDGNYNYVSDAYSRVTTVIKADAKYKVVSAASVYAKVTRDDFMSSLPRRYKKYVFDAHVGYGTALHKIKLREYGACDIHRQSFRPVASLSATKL